MAKFRRYDGFSGSVPQKFIDSKLTRCPMCGTNEPYWTINMKAGWLNRYLFKCDKCGAIISSTVADVTGVGRSAFNTLGLIKKMSGKNTKTIYMKIDEVGSSQATDIYKDKELSLEELQSMSESR